jgi:hypothetical protein
LSVSAIRSDTSHADDADGLDRKSGRRFSGQKATGLLGRTVAVEKSVMTISRILTPVVFAATFALAATPAFAQHHGGGGHGGGGSHGSAVSRGGGSRGGGGASRGVARAHSAPVYRSGGNVRGGVVVRGGGVRVAPRIVGSRGVIVGRSSFGRSAFGRSSFRRSSFGRPVFSRPFYSFRPRLSLGFGLFVGYPVPYPYYYDYPYGYAYPYPPDPYAYGYAAPSYGYPVQPYPPANQAPTYPSSNYPASDYPEGGSSYPAQQPGPSVGVQQGGQQAAPGGVTFDITPSTAAVFVDGTYVGTAGDFGPTSQPLGLITGRHRIEVRASGYRTMTFDADVTAGQVIPYRGTLERD